MADESGVPVGWMSSREDIVRRCSANDSRMDENSLPYNGNWMACFHDAKNHYYVYQNVDISSYARAVDWSNVLVNATGYFRIDQNSIYTNQISLQIKFLDYRKNEIPGSQYDSGTQHPAAWTLYGVENHVIPTRARYIQIRFNIWGRQRIAGSADAFSIKIKGNIYLKMYVSNYFDELNTL